MFVVDRTHTSFIYPHAIPKADFGVDIVQPLLPQGWLVAEIPGFYFINEQTGTDSGRTYGSPLFPRATVPNTLPAGSVVLVGGTSYTHAHTSPNNFVMNGTVTQPIWIVNLTNWTGAIQVIGSYGVFTGRYYTLTGGQFFSVVVMDPADHIVLREFDLDGNHGAGGIGIAAFGAGTLTGIVCFRLAIHDTGNSAQTATNADNHGITIGHGSFNIWVMECNIARCEGDGIQIEASAAQGADQTRFIYIGRNISANNQQHGFWAKYASDVVFSENDCYGHTVNSFGIGTQIGTQYATQKVIVTRNHLHHGTHGYGSASYTIAGDVTCFQNVMNDCRGGSDILDVYAAGGGIWAHGQAGGILLAIDNTIHNCDVGLGVPIAGPAFVYLHDTDFSKIARATLNFEDGAVFAGSDFGNNTTDHPWSLVVAATLFPQS